MRILLSLTVVLATMAIFSASSEAQCGYGNGYGFGAGLRSGCGYGYNGGYSPREQLPYFAKFPPVYYSGIVRRPYGISPFAAPSGIAPVELSVPQPVTVNNPFFETEVTPVSNEVDNAPVANDSDGNKVTWRPNPYIESIVIVD